MTTGSCFCGNIKISYSGEPANQATCHCLDCRKISGSTYSTNLIVSEDGFKVTQGTTKTISKTGDSGNTITSHFCGDCGTTLYRETGLFAGSKIVKAGVLDDYDALNKAKPALELYTKHRVNWVPETAGAQQT
ncbi:glutathione-dependent formaldehyde-activating protein [Diplodia corticola]|uniref:Glutathione-dependent formaldehyde-activating protein n=1 Tax=Diplodia corticola TaxID=236234 RepID=A0A1J9R9R4_9PEZI|nr:glutathione-dependent formaldehyde-activating protein [Diplodia corticola]OJD29179.1 glutathione-dependent formaldehyde-activating protein [Diplodia corticola]